MMQNKVIVKPTQCEIKRASKNMENATINAMMYLLVVLEDCRVTIQKGKKATKTTKMHLPSKITFPDGVVIHSDALIALVPTILNENGPNITTKHVRRSVEARTNNALIELLTSRGYKLKTKLKRASKLTDSLIRVNSIGLPSGEILDIDDIVTLGAFFDKVVESKIVTMQVTVERGDFDAKVGVSVDCMEIARKRESEDTVVSQTEVESPMQEDNATRVSDENAYVDMPNVSGHEYAKDGQEYDMGMHGFGMHPGEGFVNYYYYPYMMDGFQFGTPYQYNYEVGFVHVFPPEIT